MTQVKNERSWKTKLRTRMDAAREEERKEHGELLDLVAKSTGDTKRHATKEHEKTRDKFDRGNAEVLGRIETLTAENLYLKRNAEVLQSSSKKIEQSVAEINEKLESLTQDSFSRRLEDDLVGACVSQNGSEDMSSIGASVSSDDKHATRNAAKKVSARHSLVSSETIPGSAKRPSMIPRRPGSVKSTSVCKVRPTPTPSGPRQPEAYDKHVDNIERGRENTLHDKLCKGEGDVFTTPRKPRRSRRLA